MCHRAGGPHQAEIQLGRGEAVGRTCASEVGEHVPRGAAETEISQATLDAGVDVGGRSTQAADHRDRCEVKLGPCRGPLREHPINVVTEDRCIFKLRYSIFSLRHLPESTGRIGNGRGIRPVQGCV